MFAAARTQFYALEALPASDSAPSDRLEEDMPALFRATSATTLPSVGLSLLLALVSIILTGLLIVAVFARCTRTRRHAGRALGEGPLSYLAAHRPGPCSSE